MCLEKLCSYHAFKGRDLYSYFLWLAYRKSDAKLADGEK